MQPLTGHELRALLDEKQDESRRLLRSATIRYGMESTMRISWPKDAVV
jgi:hypothetical protein